jgi:hypothetical protein
MPGKNRGYLTHISAASGGEKAQRDLAKVHAAGWLAKPGWYGRLTAGA